MESIFDRSVIQVCTANTAGEEETEEGRVRNGMMLRGTAGGEESEEDRGSIANSVMEYVPFQQGRDTLQEDWGEWIVSIRMRKK